MAYRIYIDGTALPVAPEKISMKTNSQNSTVTLIDGKEVSILRPPGLREIRFEALLPNVRYPFAVYSRGFYKAKYYLDKLENLQKKQKKFRLIISRETQGGTLLHDTNMLVTLEQADTEEADTDVVVSLCFREYLPCGPQQLSKQPGGGSTRTVIRVGGVSDEGARHTVVKGDCLYNLAKQYLGDGNRYPEVYQKNKAVIDAGNKGTGNPRYTIYPRQVLEF